MPIAAQSKHEETSETGEVGNLNRIVFARTPKMSTYARQHPYLANVSFLRMQLAVSSSSRTLHGQLATTEILSPWGFIPPRGSPNMGNMDWRLLSKCSICLAIFFRFLTCFQSAIFWPFMSLAQTQWRIGASSLTYLFLPIKPNSSAIQHFYLMTTWVIPSIKSAWHTS